MPESIERILEALAPYLRSELDGLGYPTLSPERDDLLQEIRIRIWKALKGRDGKIQYFNAYVKKVVLSVFINEVKRLRRERQLISIAEDRRSMGDAGEGNCAGSDNPLRDIIIESLAALGETRRRVIELRLEGFTLAEIARLYHWSVGKACNEFYRGIQELKNGLAERGIHYED